MGIDVAYPVKHILKEVTLVADTIPLVFIDSPAVPLPFFELTTIVGSTPPTFVKIVVEISPIDNGLIFIV